ncbi:MAG: hypothetical protein AAFU65_16310 [Pseudomonadota bacterium]
MPDLLALHASDPRRFPFLLQSAATGGSAQRTLGRYDILFCDPREALELAHDAPDQAADFFDALNERARPQWSARVR